MKQMSLSTAEKVIKAYKEIAWHNWGEPLLYKEFEGLTELVIKYGTDSQVSSNFSLPISDSYFEALSFHKAVIVSMSGMTQDVYEIYNKGGNVNLVLENIRKLAEIRKGRKVINWESHKYNQHQVPLVVDMCNKYGYKFNPFSLNCEVEDCLNGFNHELLKRPKYRSRRASCGIKSIHAIGVDGKYYLCCASHNVPIGLSIDDIFTEDEILQRKSESVLCKKCDEHKYWRMYC
jgi:hypothetical protein